MIRLALTALAASMAMSGAAFANEVRVTLTGVEARGGTILAALQTESQFMQGGSYNASASSPSAPGSVELVFHGVAAGEYALAVLHDANNNQRMEMLSNGMPGEGWALTNGGSLTGPPTFAVVKFTVADGDVHLSEQMFYPPAQ